MIERGGIYWVDLGQPEKSRPAKRRPVVVIQSDAYNRSKLATVVVAVLTTNTRLAEMPGNVFVPAATAGLLKDSAINVTALATVDKVDLEGPVGSLPAALLDDLARGLRQVLNL